MGTQTASTAKQYSGIHMKKSGKLILKGSILNVFKGTFSSDISNQEEYIIFILNSKMKIKNILLKSILIAKSIIRQYIIVKIHLAIG